MKVLLGITGGVAAYKAAEVIRGLTELGHEVKVLPTQNALRFIGATTLEALSHNVVDSDLYTDVESVKHIELAKWADTILVAPATASFLARTAMGLADDLLGNVILASAGRIVIAPAMHTEMWQNAATLENVALLRQRGCEFVDPGVGRLTGSDSGVGRLADPADIVSAVLSFGSLAGRRVIVTAGGTREPIDPVRFIGNSSSGKQGIAIAQAAAAAGAEVELIAANIEHLPRGFKTIEVSTALEMQRALEIALADSDVLVMAAAVADYRIAEVSASKLKKSALGESTAIQLVANPDILKSINVPGLFKVGFAAETNKDLAAIALDKLQAKGCDLLVANDVSDGAVFGSNANSVVIFDKAGLVEELSGSKLAVANRLVDIISKRLG
jgi:phosphopantothenoylcysteine decarboxylase/phosphopantothenate--cysteine ligase